MSLNAVGSFIGQNTLGLCIIVTQLPSFNLSKLKANGLD